MGKSFWIPVFVSGLFFSIGSITTIFNEVNLSLTSTNEIVQIAQFIALCFLSLGIYGYSKRIKKNLSEKIIIPEAISMQNDKMEAHIVPTRSIDKRIMTSNNVRIKTASGCNHQLGYLRTFPINTSLPEECLNCDKVMECKRSKVSSPELGVGEVA
jgi:hypothetical protein